MKMMEFRKMIDELDPLEIEWVRDDGTIISCNKDLITAFTYTGMGNTYFATSVLSQIIDGKEQELLDEFKDLIEK
jgi:hypothetical protein